MNREWWDWMQETIDRRREEPHRDDLIDGLLHSEVEGRPLTDDEIVRVLMIMILGGVTTTTDTITSVMLRLAVTPGMQEELAGNLEVMPRAVEEFLRIEPPATGISRKARRDVEVGGQQLKAGDNLFYHIPAANRDPRKFEDPLEVRFDRARNPHFTFGGGIHRCIGASFARQNLRIVFEQIVTRMPELRLVEGDPPERMAGIGWMMKRLPIAFTPGPRSGG
jgi:cytochrome P450